MSKLYDWNIFECDKCNTVIAIPTYTSRIITDGFNNSRTATCVGCKEEFRLVDSNKGLMQSNRGLEVVTTIKLTDIQI